MFRTFRDVLLAEQACHHHDYFVVTQQIPCFRLSVLTCEAKVIAEIVRNKWSMVFDNTHLARMFRITNEDTDAYTNVVHCRHSCKLCFRLLWEAIFCWVRGVLRRAGRWVWYLRPPVHNSTPTYSFGTVWKGIRTLPYVPKTEFGHRKTWNIERKINFAPPALPYLRRYLLS